MPERLWRTPVLREDVESERRSTWIELFFDLAFVALVAAISGNLAHQVGVATMAESGLLFASMWAVWRYSAIYADRFETDDVSYRLALLGIMAAVTVMAVSVAEGLTPGFRGFAVGYVACDLIILVLWQRGARHNPSFRGLATQLTIAHVLAIVFWVAAVVVGTPAGWWLGLCGLAADLGVPLVSTRLQEGLPELSATHMPERLGTFTIVVLGEALIALVAGLSVLRQRSPIAWVAGATVLLLITGVYWMYFDQVAWDRPPADPFRRNITQYLHLPLAMAIALTSTFTGEYVASPLVPFSTSSRLLFTLGVALALVSIAVLDTMMASESIRACVLGRSRTSEFVAAGVLVVIGVLGAGLPGLAIVAAADAAVLTVIMITALADQGECVAE